MNKILDVLLFPLIELVGWLIMRDLRRWARGSEIRTPAPHST